jgi:hypothetical protein
LILARILTLYATSRKSIMNKALLIGGLVLVVIATITTPNAYLNYEIKESKQIVIVKLVELPNCENGSYKNKFVRFEFKGSEITKRTSCKYVDKFHVGQNIEMFHKNTTNNFVFRNEDVFTNLVSSLLIGLLGIVIAFIAIRKNK